MKKEDKSTTSDFSTDHTDIVALQKQQGTDKTDVATNKGDIATIKKDRTTDDKKMNAATAALKTEQGKLEA